MHLPAARSRQCSSPATGRCPGPANCDFTEQAFVSKAGEAVRTVNRRCRFYTLLDRPATLPIPPELPVWPRADFLYRAWEPAELHRTLVHLF